MSTAMVLAAGHGTRLSPLTDTLPKPLVPLGDRSLLAHILERLRARGIRRAVLNLHHMADEFFNITEELSIIPQLIVEQELLGTAGGIAGARRALGPAPVVVHTGDILTDPPVQALLRAVGEGLCLAVAARDRGQGSVGLDAGGRVVRLRGRVFGTEASGGDYAGVCALGARCLESLPERGCLIGDWALPELEAGRSILSVPLGASWTDVGTLPLYLQANLEWLGTRDHYVGPAARVPARVSLRRSIVGAGARVTGHGVLEECVVWPGALAVAPLERAVVTDQGVVPIIG